MTKSDEPDLLNLYLSDGYSIDDLYVELADQASLGADELNKGRAGSSFFSNIWRQNKGRICDQPVVKSYMGDPNTADFTSIAAQIVNMFIEVPGINMSLVAALAVRVGLRQLCRSSNIETS